MKLVGSKNSCYAASQRRRSTLASRSLFKAFSLSWRTRSLTGEILVHDLVENFGAVVAIGEFIGTALRIGNGIAKCCIAIFVDRGVE